MLFCQQLFYVSYNKCSLGFLFFISFYFYKLINFHFALILSLLLQKEVKQINTIFVQMKKVNQQQISIILEENLKIKEQLLKKDGEILQLFEMIGLYKQRMQIISQYESKIYTLQRSLLEICKRQNQNEQEKIKLFEQRKKQENQTSENSIKIFTNAYCQTSLDLQIVRQIDNTSKSIEQNKVKAKQKVFNSKSKQKNYSTNSYSIYKKMPTLPQQQLVDQYQQQQDNCLKDQNFRYSYQENFHPQKVQAQSSSSQFIDKNITNMHINTTASTQIFEKFIEQQEDHQKYYKLKKSPALNNNNAKTLKGKIRNTSSIGEKSFLNQNNDKSSFSIKNTSQSYENIKPAKEFKKLRQFLLISSNNTPKLNREESQVQSSEIMKQSWRKSGFGQQKFFASTGFSKDKDRSINHKSNLSTTDKFLCQNYKKQKIRYTPSTQNLLRIKKCYQLLKN